MENSTQAGHFKQYQGIVTEMWDRLTMKCPLTGSGVDNLVTRWERNYRRGLGWRKWVVRGHILGDYALFLISAPAICREVSTPVYMVFCSLTGPEVDSGICHGDEKPGWQRVSWRSFGDVKKCVSRVEPHLKNSRVKSVFETHSKLSAKDKTDKLYTAK